MARKITGLCNNCGSPEHPKGNIFTIIETWWVEIEGSRFEMPETEFSKVCNNCHYPHKFHPRVSAKARDREATLNWLLED